MNNFVTCRTALKTDLPGVLGLYAQPDLDDDDICVLDLQRKESSYNLVLTFLNCKHILIPQSEGR